MTTTVTVRESFKRARDSYVGQDTSYSPLWELVGGAFMSFIQARHGDSDYDPAMYVPERTRDGVREHDVQEHVESDAKCPFVVVAPAGLGKTTFLKHALQELCRAEPSRCECVWIDVLQLADPRDVASLYQAVEQAIGSQLEKLVSRGRSEFLDWWTFLLQNWSDARGSSSLLLDHLRSGASVDEDFRSRLLGLLQGATLLELFRLRLAFIRQRTGKIPVLVLDNSDRLPQEFQQRLLKLALVLASGSETVGLADHAVVLMALRPESLSDATPPGLAVTLYTRGELAPPDLVRALEKRLDWFFANWDSRIVRGVNVREKQALVMKALQNTAEISHENLNDVARRTIRNLARAVTTGANFQPMVDEVHRLTHYNTRLTLLAIAGYVASGHHEWRPLLEAASNDKPYTPSRNKIFKALLLGARSVFQTSSSWAVNVFVDGTVDSVGATLTLRILKPFKHLERERGLTRDEVVRNLDALFGWSEDRVRRRLDGLWRLGLLLDSPEGMLKLTETGQAYLQGMTRNFEYLQHVLVDTWVDARYLVPCRDRDEFAQIRFDRVLRFAEWIREVEVSQVSVVLKRGADDLYEQCYGIDTISFAIASTLDDSLHMLPGADGWTAECDRLRALLRDSAGDRVLQAARDCVAGTPQ